MTSLSNRADFHSVCIADHLPQVTNHAVEDGALRMTAHSTSNKQDGYRLAGSAAADDEREAAAELPSVGPSFSSVWGGVALKPALGPTWSLTADVSIMLSPVFSNAEPWLARAAAVVRSPSVVSEQIFDLAAARSTTSQNLLRVCNTANAVQLRARSLARCRAAHGCAKAAVRAVGAVDAGAAARMPTLRRMACPATT